jgi:glycosyltransferase involved in cell wall biosynthesis
MYAVNQMGKEPQTIRIAVVVPAYKVARFIKAVVSGIPDFVSEIIVVDDASPDETSAIVESLHDARIHLIRHERNGGVGAAVMTGYQYAKDLGVDVVVKLDGDNQMDPEYIQDLVAPILAGEADYAKGCRFLHTRQLTRMPLVRRVGNTGLSFLAKASSGYWNIADPANGFTAVHTRVLDAIDWDNVDQRWFFETSLLIELGLARAVVRDIYMPARYADETSTLSEVGALIRFPRRLVESLIRRTWLQYFVLDFSPVALFLLAGAFLSGFGVIWGAIHWLTSAVTHVPATTGTVVISLFPLLVGAQLVLQAIVIDIQGSPKVPLTRFPRRLQRLGSSPRDVGVESDR